MIYILSQIYTHLTEHYFYNINNGIIYSVVEYKDDILKKRCYIYPYTEVEFANISRQIDEFSYNIPDDDDVMVKIGDDCDALFMVKREIEYKIFDNI